MYVPSISIILDSAHYSYVNVGGTLSCGNDCRAYHFLNEVQQKLVINIKTCFI